MTVIIPCVLKTFTQMQSKIYQNLLLRTFSTQCPPVPVGGIYDYVIQNTTLPNKMVVSSAENESPVSIISIIYRAGTRDENCNTPGLVHTLQTCAFVTTKNATEFAITRNVQQNGAILSCSGHRQMIVYSLRGTRKAIEKTLPFLTEIATNQIYQPWDVSDNVSRQKEELKFLSPLKKVRDLIHRAAFRRGGLGNLLYIPEYNLGNVSSENLQHFVKSNFKASRAVVVALGVDHGMLLQYVSNLNIRGGNGSHPSSPYVGGEIRQESGGQTATIALALKGLPYSFKNVTISRIITKALLGNQAFKSRCSIFGKPQMSPCTPLGKALENISDAIQIVPFHYCYSETGILGVIISASKDSVGKIVDAAAKSLKTSSLDKEEFHKAKIQTGVEFSMKCESPLWAVDLIGRQTVYDESIHNLKELADIIERVKLDEVNRALKTAAEGKLSLAAIGNLETVPYLDELKDVGTSC